MSEEPKVIDGADRRKKRLLDMLGYIHNMKDENGATNKQIKGFMFVKFGLKFKTSATYIQEAHLSGLISLDGILWNTTSSYKKLAIHLYS